MNHLLSLSSKFPTTRKVTILLGFIFVLLSTSSIKTFAATNNFNPWDCPYIHFVQKGETIGQIAARYGISVRALMDVNDLFPPYKLVEWQPLCIPTNKLTTLFPKSAFSAWIFMSDLSLSGKGFPILYKFQVKIRKLPLGSWVKLCDQLIVDEQGNFLAHYRLPDKYADDKKYEVCLKDPYFGFVTCTKVDNRWLSGRRMKWKGGWITIPTR